MGGWVSLPHIGKSKIIIEYLIKSEITKNEALCKMRVSLPENRDPCISHEKKPSSSQKQNIVRHAKGYHEK